MPGLRVSRLLAWTTVVTLIILVRALTMSTTSTVSTHKTFKSVLDVEDNIFPPHNGYPLDNNRVKSGLDVEDNIFPPHNGYPLDNNRVKSGLDAEDNIFPPHNGYPLDNIRDERQLSTSTVSLPESAKSSLVQAVSVFESANFKSYTRFSHQLIAFLSEADHVFLLTGKDCQFENLPVAWEHKSSCVNAARLDSTLYNWENYVGSHHVRITNSHRLFVKVARVMNWSSVAILEGDITSYSADEVDDRALAEYRSLLRSDNWDMIRFGYRPFSLETEVESCPEECTCVQFLGKESMGGHGCAITSGACDMRSSDAYILNSNSFEEFDALLENFTVDMEPMQRLPRIWFSTPQLAFQVDSAQSIESQIESAKKFYERCIHE